MTTAARRCPRCKAAHPGPIQSGVAITCDSCGHRWTPLQSSDEYFPVEDRPAPPAPLTERRTPPKPLATPGNLPFDQLERDSRGARSPHPVSELAFRPSTDSLNSGGRTSCPVCGHSFVGKPNSDDQRCPACGTSFQCSTGRLTPGSGAGGDRLIGRVLRGCQIDRKLGEGGMGAVYHARQLSLDRSVAIKVLPPELARNRNFIQRFEREAKSLARINHANILQIYDFGDDPQLGVYFMVIEYVDGWDLGEVLRRQPTLSQIETLDIIRQALLGLEQATEKGVIHRDIKPDNLMVATSGLCKVSDFGLAKGSAGDSEVTSVGVRVGTPAFMSPEQCDGVEVDTRSDVYNLGCTAFLMLTGHLPYDGETPFSIMLKHKVDPVPSVRSYRPEIDARIESLVRQMMAKRPDDRCFELRELIDEAERLLVDLTGTGSVLRKTNGPIRALVQHASGQGSSGRRSSAGSDLPSADANAPIPGAKPSGRQRALPPQNAPSPPPGPGAPQAIPDWLRPIDGPSASPPAPAPSPRPAPPPPGSRTAQAPAIGSRTAQAPAIGSRTAQAPAVGSRTAQAPAIGSRAGPGRAASASSGSQVVPPPTLATPFPGLATPLPDRHKPGSSSSAMSAGAIDRARDRGLKAEVSSIAAGAERLAAAGSWEPAASEYRRAAQLARDTGESRRLSDLAKDAAARARSRRRLRGLLIGALSAALLGVNAWIWPPVVHNLIAERERTRLEAIADPAERSRRLREFAAANQGGWLWYRAIFRRSYEVPAAAAAASAAESRQTPAPPPPVVTAPQAPVGAPRLAELTRLAADPAVPLSQVAAAARPLAADPQAATVLADAERRLASARASRQAVDAAREQGRHGEALDLAARLAVEQPRCVESLAGLPLPGRVRATDADSGGEVPGLRLAVDGVEVVGEGRFCRRADGDVQLDIAAAGYAPRRIAVTAAADPAERLVEVALGPAPVWRLAAPASRPAWIRLHPAGTAVIALTADAATVIDAASGAVRQLTLPGIRLLPWWSAGDGSWSFATVDGEQRQILPNLDRAVPVRRLAGAPLALLEIELVYRAGGRLAVSVEDVSGGRALIARDGAREAWRLAGVAGTAEPLLRRSDDKLVLIDDLTVRVVEEDGSEAARLALKAARTGPWAELPNGRLLLATAAGVELVQLGKTGAQLVQHPWLTEAGPAVPVAAGEVVALARADRAIDIATWATDPVKPRWRAKVAGRPLQAAIGGELLAVCDDGGSLTVIRIADGQTVRRIAHGAPAMAPPLLLPGVVVIADQTGAVTGYRLPQ